MRVPPIPVAFQPECPFLRRVLPMALPLPGVGGGNSNRLEEKRECVSCD